MTISMTGFAARKGQGAGYSWAWDIRSVNGKGLDLRLRVPDWIDGLEMALKADLAKALQRGNVSLSLKVAREGEGSDAAIHVNPGALKAILSALAQVEEEAMSQGVTLRQATSADILLARGVLDTTSLEADTTPLRQAILADLPALIADFQTMRAAEGAALHAVIEGQLGQIASLTQEARTEAEARRDSTAQALKDSLAKILANSDGLDETRIAQELALIAVKNDVTEELDRLSAHIDAARSLLQETTIGHKFDFLMQEFMREANTLCAKSQSHRLTRIGLDLKVTIDQLREQVQNVE